VFAPGSGVSSVNKSAQELFCVSGTGSRVPFQSELASPSRREGSAFKFDRVHCICFSCRTLLVQASQAFIFAHRALTCRRLIADQFLSLTLFWTICLFGENGYVKRLFGRPVYMEATKTFPLLIVIWIIKPSK
jgi:hypothetical protein